MHAVRLECGLAFFLQIYAGMVFEWMASVSAAVVRSENWKGVCHFPEL